MGAFFAVQLVFSHRGTSPAFLTCPGLVLDSRQHHACLHKDKASPQKKGRQVSTPHSLPLLPTLPQGTYPPPAPSAHPHHHCPLPADSRLARSNSSPVLLLHSI